MKSRKLRAVLAALSAVAVLATAMTGFAAATVTTTTEYVAGETNAHVVSVVSGANGDVTYLAKTTDGFGVNSSGILYIDQKHTSGEDITFDYYVNKSVINGAVTTLALGTNGTEPFDNTGKTLEIRSTANVDGNGYTITYDEDYYGNGDGSVTAVIEAKPGYEIKKITIAGEEKDITEPTFAVPVIGGQLAEVIVDVQKQVVTPSVVVLPTEGEEGGKYTLTTVFKIIGADFEEVGLTYNGMEFPAVYGVDTEEYVAVKIINDVEFDGYDTYIK